MPPVGRACVANTLLKRLLYTTDAQLACLLNCTSPGLGTERSTLGNQSASWLASVLLRVLARPEVNPKIEQYARIDAARGAAEFGAVIASINTNNWSAEILNGLFKASSHQTVTRCIEQIAWKRDCNLKPPTESPQFLGGPIH